MRRQIAKNIAADIYLLKVNKRNTRTRCEICSKLTIKTPERRQASLWYLNCYLWTYFTCCSSVFTVNFEHATAGRDDVDKTSIKQSTLSNHFLSDRLQILISCRKVIEISYIFSLVLIQAWPYISPGNMNAFISVDWTHFLSGYFLKAEKTER